MSDTPRTSGLARGNYVVPTEFAEQLERELSTVRWERDEALNDLEFRRGLFKLQEQTLEECIVARDEYKASADFWKRLAHDATVASADLNNDLKQIKKEWNKLRKQINVLKGDQP